MGDLNILAQPDARQCALLLSMTGNGNQTQRFRTELREEGKH